MQFYGITATDSLAYTFKLFQDAVNYHLVALAGMAISGDATITATFREQVEKIWNIPPRDKDGAQTLQQSLCQTLNLPPHSSFEEVVQEIFNTTERKEILPYVLQLVVERIASGDIQQGSKDLLPKLCDANFIGNYDYSYKEKLAQLGNQRLQQELNSEDLTEPELRILANEMDLSWAGIKTQANAERTQSVLYSPEETAGKVKEAMEELLQVLNKKTDSAWNQLEAETNIDLADFVRHELNSTTPTYSATHCMAKDAQGAIKPTNKNLKLAAIFFMYYPSSTSAKMLSKKLRPAKKAQESDSKYDINALENDPFLLCRGQIGYVYRGYTALNEWETEGGNMYSRSWDILAFSEALKTLHSFEQKTNDRNKHLNKLKSKLLYIETGTETTKNEENDETLTPVLGGDPRFQLLKELLAEIAPEGYDDYTISRRALNSYDEILEKWLAAEKRGKGDEASLRAIVREVQGSGVRFGAGILFEALCSEKYKPIWHEWQGDEKSPVPRSRHLLNDYNRYQELKLEIAQYEEPVRITAAEVNESPRQLLYSDLKSFGPKGKGKGHEFIKGKKGYIRLRTAIRNAKGHLETTPIIARYSAPRFERDELGTDAAFWTAGKKSATNLNSWLQPMMKALNLNKDDLLLDGEPAVGLQIKRYPASTKKHGGFPSEPICLLNFPVSLDLEKIHKQIGKAEHWNNQMLKVEKAKLHLHWPATYSGKSTPWWEKQQIKKEGFNVLGIDLGMRYAAAWALINVQTSPEIRKPSGAVIEGRLIGNTADKQWYGYCQKSGLIRIDGEGKGPGEDSTKTQFIAGVGKPTNDDIKLSDTLFRMAGITPYPAQNILELCNQANKAFRRLLSRCRTYQSLLADLKDPEKSLNAIEKITAIDETIYQLIPGMVACFKKQEIEKGTSLLLCALLELRNELPKAAAILTNLLLPRKRGEWVWVSNSAPQPGYISSGKMVIGGDATPKRKIFYRGGLSIKRLSQIEDLRRLIQSMNRILHETPGVRADFGHNLKNIRVVDPCPDILRKIENIREQRVNKIAHEITALALGVQLIAPRNGKNSEGRDIIHGEYTTIPNRKPVDFVVLEDLSRYLTSIDRTPEENSNLMRWSHRQIVAKVTQLLEEVFGIPVLFTHAAYTSKFDSITSAPGFRAVEMTDRRLEKMGRNNDEEELKLKGYYQPLLNAAKDRRDGLKLLMPGYANDGEFFICNTSKGIRMRNADINAAINIAWRALAAPEALHLLHRVRLCNEKGNIKPKYSNQREKALKKSWVFTPISTSANNRSHDFSTAFQIDQTLPIKSLAHYSSQESKLNYSLVSGKDLWSYMKKQRWNLCHQFNIKVLKKLNIDTSPLERFLAKQDFLRDDDSDITY